MKNNIKIFLILLIFNIGLNSEVNEIIKEYNVEIIIFKYINNQSNESFISELKIPEEEIIRFYNPDLYINKSALNNFVKTESFFSSLFKNITPKYSNSEDKNSTKKIKNPNPKNWFREINNLDTLKKIKSNMAKDKNIEFIDSKRWIQGIDSYESSKFLYEDNKLKNYGIYIKLYKKRYIHAEIKAFIGANNQNIKIKPVDAHIKEIEKRIYKNNNNINNYDLNISYPENIENLAIISKNENNEFINNSDLNIYIDEEERIFKEEIYLFDHPNFGIILSVSEI
tara:strand:+ start:8015 stop:8863 length:849 start_codon:yes stop_codon:yes gene_type:complete